MKERMKEQKTYDLKTSIEGANVLTTEQADTMITCLLTNVYKKRCNDIRVLLE